MDLSFLDDIKLSELDGKDEIVKSVRFSKEDFYLLKYLQYKNKKFSYVKELIVKDINNEFNASSSISKDDIKTLIKQTLKEDDELKDIIRDILKEDGHELESENEHDSKDDNKQIETENPELLAFMKKK